MKTVRMANCVTLQSLILKHKTSQGKFHNCQVLKVLGLSSIHFVSYGCEIGAPSLITFELLKEVYQYVTLDLHPSISHKGWQPGQAILFPAM